MSATRIAIQAALASPAFTWGEKKILEWQFPDDEDPGFYLLLMRALAHADYENEGRILTAFPDLAAAWYSFRCSSAFATKCAAHGIDL